MLEARIVFGCCVLVGLVSVLLVLTGAGIFSRRPAGGRTFRPVVMLAGLLFLVPATYWALLASGALFPPDSFGGPWQEATTKDGVLSAQVPGRAICRADDAENGRALSETLVFDDVGDFYCLGCAESERSKEFAADVLLGNCRKESLAIAGKFGEPVVAGEKTLATEGFPGREWKIDAGDKVIRVRAYVIKGRIYQATAILDRGERGEMLAKRFLESVTIAKGI